MFVVDNWLNIYINPPKIDYYLFLYNNIIINIKNKITDIYKYKVVYKSEKQINEESIDYHFNINNSLKLLLKNNNINVSKVFLELFKYLSNSLLEF